MPPENRRNISLPCDLFLELVLTESTHFLLTIRLAVLPFIWVTVSKRVDDNERIKDGEADR